MKRLLSLTITLWSLGVLILVGILWSLRQEPSEASFIAFVSYRDGNYEIYRMHPDGRGVRRLTHHLADDSNPQWLSDGERLVFVSNRSGRNQFYQMRSDGTGVQKSSLRPDRTVNLDLSPDGQWIAFVTNRDGNPEIYRMHPDGTALTNLTQHPTHDFQPSWSPLVDLSWHGERLGLLGLLMLFLVRQCFYQAPPIAFRTCSIAGLLADS